MRIEGQRADQPVPLMLGEEEEAIRARWATMQAACVDEPRRAAKEAEAPVAKPMNRLSEMFTSERGKLEGQWSRQEEVSTENLRLVLQRYRSFFDRLLGMTAKREPDA